MIDSLWTGGGIVLLVLLFADLLLTVFHPQGHGGPLHRRLNRLFWATLRRCRNGLGGTSKDRFLALLGPLIAVFSVGTWGLWLILSFTCIYYPYRGSLLSTTADDTSWLDVFYFSGYVASTLGIGDLVPVSVGLRLLTVIEAMSGFALFAVATTYLLAVYQYVAKEQVLALEMASVLDDGGAQLAPSPGHAGDDPVLGSWGAALARHLLEVIQAHGQYPVLHYFRPVDTERALIIQIGLLLDRLEQASPDTAGQLRWVVRRYLMELDSGCLPGDHRRHFHGHASVGEAGLRRIHARLLDYLDYPVSPHISSRKEE